MKRLILLSSVLILMSGCAGTGTDTGMGHGFQPTSVYYGA